LFSFVNVATVLYFLHLNKKRSPYRYLVAVLGCGEPVAATFIFTFAEVFGGFENMTGGVADTLLALVWTQYQYFVFPLIFGVWGFHLLREGLRRCDSSGGDANARFRPRTARYVSFMPSCRPAPLQFGSSCGGGPAVATQLRRCWPRSAQEGGSG
jgi:hypothetical protein